MYDKLCFLEKKISARGNAKLPHERSVYRPESFSNVDLPLKVTWSIFWLRAREAGNFHENAGIVLDTGTMYKLLQKAIRYF